MEKGGRQTEPKEYKTFPSIALKFDEDEGVVDHIITVFGVLDHVKDISHPGSFKKTIQDRQGKVRVLDMHRSDSIMRVIAKPLSLKEVTRDQLPRQLLDRYPEATGGVMASTKFLMDTPEGKGAFIRLKEEAVDEWSYGYDPLDVDYSTVKQDGEDVKIRNLRQIRLYEYGPVLWGANPATATLSAKVDGDPTEAKPAPEVTENTIRIRVRNPDDFQEGSFRTIPIGGDDSGIQATVGKLDGENTMTIQSYIFDKDKFSVEEAQEWVDEHKKSLNMDLGYALYAESLGKSVDGLTTADKLQAVAKLMLREGELVWIASDKQEDEGPYQCECIECGHTMESEEHCRDIKCPECSGEMRRAERPGPGKEDEGPDETSAVWTAAYINDLPDSAFLYIAPGGEKDEEGKTKPRNLRYFPYKDADGSIDLPHLRNAIARIPQSNAPGLTAAKKEQLQERARRMLDEAQGKDVEPASESKEVLDEVVMVSFILQGLAEQLDEESWERKAAELAVAKLKALYGEADVTRVAELEKKAGRVLAARNEARIRGALLTLIEVLEDAGIVDIPGLGREPEPEEGEEEEKTIDRNELEVLIAETEIALLNL